jgi:hypothetical protein
MWRNKPCDHPGFSEEYYMGAQTGDFICNQCGKCFLPEEREWIEAERGKVIQPRRSYGSSRA